VKFDDDIDTDSEEVERAYNRNLEDLKKLLKILWGINVK
jgi:hypothetical protein